MTWNGLDSGLNGENRGYVCKCACWAGVGELNKSHRHLQPHFTPKLILFLHIACLALHRDIRTEFRRSSKWRKNKVNYPMLCSCFPQWSYFCLRSNSACRMLNSYDWKQLFRYLQVREREQEREKRRTGLRKLRGIILVKILHGSTVSSLLIAIFLSFSAIRIRSHQ